MNGQAAGVIPVLQRLTHRTGSSNIDCNCSRSSKDNHYTQINQQTNKNNSVRNTRQNLRKKKSENKMAKHRTRENKKHLNKLAKEIENKIKEHDNNEFAKFIGALSTHENSNYSLWKATKKIKKAIKPASAIRNADNTWARSNEEQAREFSNHLCNTFTPHSM